MTPRFEAALAALWLGAREAMAKKFVPECRATCTLGTLARRFEGLLLGLIPPHVVDEMSGSSDADLVRSLCHWLGVRLEQMPWVQALRRSPELRRLFASLGVPLPGLEHKRALIASLLSSLSQDHALKVNIVRAANVSDGGALPSSDLRRCPEGVELLLSQALGEA